jgi:hypothetical protein
MGVWSDSEHLVALLDRQFKVLKQLPGSRRIVRHRRLLEFLRGEPSLAGILEDFGNEARKVLGSISEEMGVIRTEVAALWGAHKVRLRGKLENVVDDMLFVFGTLKDESTNPYSNRLLRNICLGELPSDNDEVAHNSVLGLEHFAKWEKDDADQPLIDTLSKLLRRSDRATRELQIFRRSDPWISFVRLDRECREFNPEVVTAGDTLTIHSLQHEETAQRVLESERVSTVSTSDNETREVPNGDEDLLLESFVLQIGLLRSRYSLISRFAVRCEAFEAAHLRKLADTRADGKRNGKPADGGGREEKWQTGGAADPRTLSLSLRSRNSSAAGPNDQRSAARHL